MCELFRRCEIIVLIIIILLILSILLILRFVSPTLSLWIKASRDYSNARGTKHLKILQEIFIALNKRKVEKINLITDFEVQINRLKERRLEKLEVAASKFLIRKELTKVSGIGETLKERIIQQCFKKTLSSLYNVVEIQGVGSEKALAIRLWVKDAVHRLPEVILGDFRGKQNIISKYKKALDDITDQRSLLLHDLHKVEEVISKINKEINQLSFISTSTFRRALKSDIKAVNQVSQYMKGTFTELEDIPKWLKKAKKIINET
jgi:hypothetical protein